MNSETLKRLKRPVVSALERSGQSGSTEPLEYEKADQSRLER
jgi:hypothetical protein